MKDKDWSNSNVMNTEKYGQQKLVSKSRQSRLPMYEWNTIPWRQLEKDVFKLQKRIYRASKRGDTKVVRRLQRLLITSRSAKAIALRKVTRENRGKTTAGIDGVKSLNPQKRMELVNNLALANKSKPTRRISIPKPSSVSYLSRSLFSGEKEELKVVRPLEIPTMNERAKQALVKMALEPEWEAKFESNSYGFRPGRSSHDAIGAIHTALSQNPKYVLDANLKKCFDKIDHQKLLGKLNTTPKIKRQIKAWLKAGVIDNGGLFPTEMGTSQGEVFFPLLANIALHGMENLIRGKFPEGEDRSKGQHWSRQTPQLIRYADNFIILHKDIEIVQQCKVLIEDWLKEIGLQLNPEKTQISHTLEEYNGRLGFNFLGFHIQHHQVGKYNSGRRLNQELLGFKLIIKPSQESIKNHLKKIGEVINNHKSSRTENLIGTLNPIIRRWSKYFSGAISSATFKLMDHLTYQKLKRWSQRRHPKKGKKWVKIKYWKSLKNRNWVFSEISEGKITLSLINHGDTKIIRHTKVRGNKSPYDGDFMYWSRRLSKHPEVSHRNYIDWQKQRYL